MKTLKSVCLFTLVCCCPRIGCCCDNTNVILGGGGGGGEQRKDKSYVTHFDVESRKAGIDFSNMLDDLSNLDAEGAASWVMDKLTETIHDRMTKMFQKAQSAECRAKIARHFSYWLNAIGREDASFPFVESKFQNRCPEPVIDFNNLSQGTTFESIMYRTYQPPRDEAEYIEDKNDLKILYGILTHGDDARGTIRLIEALYEDDIHTTFVVHVDRKPVNDKLYNSLVLYSQNKTHVHILPREHSVRVNWGGYSMVNATMQILKYSFGLLLVDHGAVGIRSYEKPLDFHKFVHLSASSYPLKSNAEIRERISDYPLDANMIMVILKPLEPHSSAFNYYIECDDAVHRIYRLPPLSASTHGVNLYTSSQWFIISREFAWYLAKAEAGTFVYDYIQYAEHTVVADETFFGTVLRNSEFCTKHHNDNFLHLQFDRWESDIQNGQRDERKCLSPHPNRCGRSPTTLTVDDFFALELSNQLFARKFSDTDTDILDLIDEYRTADEMRHRDITAGNYTAPKMTVDTKFEGQGTLIVAKDSVNSSTPLCIGLGMSGHQVRLFVLLVCFLMIFVEGVS
jgi:Core-2/I-Branching enzyme.